MHTDWPTVVLSGIAGTVVAGAVTLVGLWLTIRHERRISEQRAHDEAVLRSRRTTNRLLMLVAMHAQDTRRGQDAIADASEDAVIVMARWWQNATVALRWSLPRCGRRSRQQSRERLKATLLVAANRSTIWRPTAKCS
jgi:hypothetical protein